MERVGESVHRNNHVDSLPSSHLYKYKTFLSLRPLFRSGPYSSFGSQRLSVRAQYLTYCSFQLLVSIARTFSSFLFFSPNMFWQWVVFSTCSRILI